MAQLELAARLNLNASDYVANAKQSAKATDDLSTKVAEVGKTSKVAAAGIDKAGKASNDAADEIKRAGKESGKAEPKIKGVGKAGSSAGKGFRQGAAGAEKLSRAEKKLDRQSKATAQSLAKTGKVAGAIFVGLAAADFTETIFELERFEGQLETTFKGSEEQAGLAFKAIESFATETPFTLNQSVEAFIKLRNLGIAPTRALMESMGNTATAMGRDMNQFMEAVADAATGEFERLKEFGVKARSEGDQVAFTFQGVTTTVGKNSDEIVGYLQGIGENNFAGAMEKQMERLPGVWSNLQDNVDSVWRAIGNQGATSLLTASIATVSGAVGDLSLMISSGMLAESLQAQLGGWIELFNETRVQISDFSGFMYEVLSGNEVETESNGFVELVMFIGRSIADLPTNLKAYVTIMIAEIDTLRIGFMEKFDLMSLAASEVWLNIEKFGSDAMGGLELVTAQSVDFIVQQLANMVGAFGDNLNALPDAIVPDSWIEGINSAESAILEYANAEAEVRAEIEQNQAAYAADIAGINKRREVTKKSYDDRRQFARTAIDDALAERQAALDLRDAEQESANAKLEAARTAGVSTEKHDELARAYLKTAEAANDSGEAAAAAGDKHVASAQRALDAVVRATNTERETLDRWYKDKIRDLEEAERLGLSTTKSYAELRADVQDQYYDKLEKLNKSSVKDNENALRDKLRDSGAFGDSLLDLYSDWGDVWSDLQSGNADAAIESFDDILDSAEDLFKQIVIKYAASGLDKLFGLGGDGGGFSFSSLFGGESSSGGGIGDILKSLAGGSPSSDGGGGIGDILTSIIGGGSSSGGGLLSSLGSLFGGNTSAAGPVEPASIAGLFSPSGSLGGLFAPGGFFGSGGAVASSFSNLTALINPYTAAIAAVVALGGPIISKLFGGGGRSPQELGLDQLAAVDQATKEGRNENVFLGESAGVGVSFIGGHDENSVFFGIDKAKEDLQSIGDIIQERFGHDQALALKDGIIRLEDFSRNYSDHHQTMVAEVQSAVIEFELGLLETERNVLASHGKNLSVLDSFFDASGDNGETNAERLISAYQLAYDATKQEAEEWLASSEITADRYAEIFGNASGLVIDTLAGVGQEAEAAALGFEDSFTGAITNISGQVFDFSADAQREFSKLRQASQISLALPASSSENVAIANGVRPFMDGTPRLQNDGLAYVHKGEMIIDPRSAEALRKYGVGVNATANNSGRRSASALDSVQLTRLINSIEKGNSETMALKREIKNMMKGGARAA